MVEFMKIVEGLFYAIATNVFATVIVNGCRSYIAKIINLPDNARIYKKKLLKVLYVIHDMHTIHFNIIPT